MPPALPNPHLPAPRSHPFPLQTPFAPVLQPPHRPLAQSQAEPPSEHTPGPQTPHRSTRNSSLHLRQNDEHSSKKRTEIMDHHGPKKHPQNLRPPRGKLLLRHVAKISRSVRSGSSAASAPPAKPPSKAPSTAKATRSRATLPLDQWVELLTTWQVHWWFNGDLPSGQLTVCYRKWPCMVDLPMNNCDFP